MENQQDIKKSKDGRVGSTSEKYSDCSPVTVADYDRLTSLDPKAASLGGRRIGNKYFFQTKENAEKFRKYVKDQENLNESIRRIVMNEIHNVLNEEGEGGMGGATSCGSVMQGGGSNPSAGQYTVPFGADKETKKRSKDFGNGSMMMRRQTYSPKTNK